MYSKELLASFEKVTRNVNSSMCVLDLKKGANTVERILRTDYLE